MVCRGGKMNIKYRTQDQYHNDLRTEFKKKQIDHHNAVFNRDTETQLSLTLELCELEHLIKFGHIEIAFIKRMISEYLNETEKETLAESFNNDLNKESEVDKLRDTIKALVKENGELELANEALMDSLNSQEDLAVGEIEKEVWSPEEMSRREG